MKENVNYDLFGEPILDAKRNMSDYFGIVPFSVLNTMSADWQKRKTRWNGLIQDTGQARANVLSGSDSEDNLLNQIGGSSVLDAVLAELMVKWFSEPGHLAFDPFAGDTVFGFVSSYLGRPFTGIELRPEQATFNQQQVDREELPARYICDSSEFMDKYIAPGSQDFVFSCPPYADLEVYSDLPQDLSTLSHTDFFRMYATILSNTYSKLKNNRFAVVVTSEVRDKKGFYIGLVPRTIQIMQQAGYHFYNDLVLVNSAGTLPLRVGKQMNSGRKVGRQHQNVLVFYKGDPKLIKQNYSEIIPKNDYYGG